MMVESQLKGGVHIGLADPKRLFAERVHDEFLKDLRGEGEGSVQDQTFRHTPLPRIVRGGRARIQQDI
jgi:hypothetical protein